MFLLPQLFSVFLSVRRFQVVLSLPLYECDLFAKITPPYRDSEIRIAVAHLPANGKTHLLSTGVQPYRFRYAKMNLQFLKMCAAGAH